MQKALVESLGIQKLALVAGPSMGALQTYEWAASYPDMVAKAMPVIGAAEADAQLIAWLDVWAAPILVDPNWNKGDYYGKTPPNAGLAKALTVVTLQANHGKWTNGTFGRRAAKEGEDPAKSLSAKSFQVQSVLDNAGEARAKVSDANHFLYLVKANQLFAAGGKSLTEGVAKIEHAGAADHPAGGPRLHRRHDRAHGGRAEEERQARDPALHPGLARPSRRGDLDETGGRRDPRLSGEIGRGRRSQTHTRQWRGEPSPGGRGQGEGSAA